MEGPKAPREFVKRDVQVVIDHLNVALDAAQRLNKVESTREMAIALTHIDTASLWLQRLVNVAPESGS